MIYSRVPFSISEVQSAERLAIACRPHFPAIGGSPCHNVPTGLCYAVSRMEK